MHDITLKEILKLIISLGLGIFVFYIVYKGLNVEEMKRYIHEAHWAYVILPIALCLLSSWVRALRWNMLIEPVAKKIPAMKNTFGAVLIGYSVNHIFPRAGEVARCGVLTKYEEISFSELIGTVITERVFDLIITVLIAFTTVVLEFDVFQNILQSVDITGKLSGLTSSPILWILLVFVAVLFFLLRRKLAESRLLSKIKKFVAGLWNGLKSFTQVKNKFLFLLYSLLIFVMYFLMLYFSFWVFDFTKDLTLEAGLVTYVFGALGMIVPVQGGIGTYEYMTMQALNLYGIAETQGGTFAAFSHLIEILVNCIAGFACYLLLPALNRKEEA